MCYECSRSTSLDFFVYDSFVKKAIQKKKKKKNIALINTLLDIFICVNKLLNARVRTGD